jgi:enamine deaminase RidA (YjgF/YER057c/UK114 family)
MSDRVFSGAPWEKTFSYCRARRIGNVVAVSGTTSLEGFGGDARKQTLRCLEIIEESLRPFGLNRANILRTRMFVTDMSRSQEFGEAHGSFFKGCEPAASMIGVPALISPEFLIEIEADAVIS